MLDKEKDKMDQLWKQAAKVLATNTPTNMQRWFRLDDEQFKPRLSSSDYL